MFSDTVDQKPTVPFRAGIRNFRNSLVLRNCGGDESMGPKPPAVFHAQTSSNTPTPSRMGALQPCRNRIDSMPLRITSTLISQKATKQMAVPYGLSRQAGHTVPSNLLMASPPNQVWIPNHPQATSARSTAATFAPNTPNDDRASTGNGMP